jgi:ubiquinol-cytochrome c reductase cytochrome b subunit
MIPVTYSATLEWIEGGQTTIENFAADSETAFDDAAAATRAALTEGGAAMVMIQRLNATDAVATTITGGAPQSRTVTAPTIDELEVHIQEVKDEVGAATPFFRVDRNEPPFVFTVTRFSQILTLYYFLFFLVILPILGLRETPGRVPDTIAKPVTA